VNRPATSINIFVAFGLAMFGSSLYVSDEYAHIVYRVDLGRGSISTYAGNGKGFGPSGDGGVATSAVVPYPQGLTVDCLGNLYILQLSSDIRRVDVKSKAITTVSSIPPTSNTSASITTPRTETSGPFTTTFRVGARPPEGCTARRDREDRGHRRKNIKPLRCAERLDRYSSYVRPVSAEVGHLWKRQGRDLATH